MGNSFFRVALFGLDAYDAKSEFRLVDSIFSMGWEGWFLCHVVCVYLFVSLKNGGWGGHGDCFSFFDESLGNPKQYLGTEICLFFAQSGLRLRTRRGGGMAKRQSY